MSLFGLDILVERETGKFYIAEINGIGSGRRGFREIYGDDRVDRKIFDMLVQRYGRLSINTGYYLRERAGENMSTYEILFLDPLGILMLNQEFHHGGYNFRVYEDQDSTVLNYVNEILPHPLVNPYVTEEITRSKFLQYLMLRETELAEHIPQSALVGMGVIDERELDEMLGKYSTFAVKPLTGSCGKDIGIVHKDHVKDFMKSYIGCELKPFVIHKSGAEPDSSLYESFSELLFSLRMLICPWVIDNRVRQRDFSFEKRIWVAQPFIDTRQTIEGKEMYTSVRAIVCNGKFVDASSRSIECRAKSWGKDERPPR